jgi:hypothetical protein
VPAGVAPDGEKAVETPEQAAMVAALDGRG